MIELNKEESNFYNGEFFLQRLVYGDSTLLNIENDFWKLPIEQQKTLFNPIIEKYKDFKFSWIEEYEGHFLESEISKKFSPYLNFFENIDISITYKTNSLGGRKYKKLNHQSILHWLGRSSTQNFEIPSERKFDKHFLYMNRLKKPWRQDFFCKIQKNNILKQSKWSWASHDKNDPLHKSIEGEVISNIDKNEFSKELQLLPEYNTTFISLVVETLFSNDGVSNNGTFITEKTEKCLASGHPFIILSTPYFLHNLKQLGFKTFDKWIDETYDKIYDGEERMDYIIDVVNEISRWSIKKCEKVYEEMIPILKHNQNINKKWWNRIDAIKDKDWIDLDDSYKFWVDIGKNKKII